MLPETYFTYYSLVLAIMVLVPSYYSAGEKVGVSNFVILNIFWLILIITGLIGGYHIVLQKETDSLTKFLILLPPLILLCEFFLLMVSYNTSKAIRKAIHEAKRN